MKDFLQDKLSRRLVVTRMVAVAAGGATALGSGSALAQVHACQALVNDPSGDYKFLGGTAPIDITRPGKLAKVIMEDKNSDYSSGGKTALPRFRIFGAFIQRHRVIGKTKLQWEFNGATIDVDHAIRFPYYAVAKKSGRCSPEHVLIGYKKGAVASTNPADWVHSNDDYGKLGRQLVELLTEPNDAQGNTQKSGSVAGWDQSIANSGEAIWTFRGAPIHIDSAISIPYAVQLNGVYRDATLYVGYEGGGAY